jgi:hypothetical protein
VGGSWSRGRIRVVPRQGIRADRRCREGAGLRREGQRLRGRTSESYQPKSGNIVIVASSTEPARLEEVLCEGCDHAISRP